MKCPVCNRDLAPTLSICPSCGAMMNDSVREEHQVKVSTSGNLPKIEHKAVTLPPPRPLVKESNPYAVPPPALVVPAAPIQRRVETAAFTSAKTSQTLVDFQNKNNAIPEWRLQMQNAVRQRRSGTGDVSSVSTQAVATPRLRTNGAAALKAEVAQEPMVIENADPRLSNALRRIADSRTSFLNEEQVKPAISTINAQPRSFPFDVIAPNANAISRPSDVKASANALPKPTLVAPLKLDTNKLPKLNEMLPKPIDRVENLSVAAEPSKPIFESIKRIFINADKASTEEEVDLIEDDEIEDLAPLSMRFNAGLFDLIIGTVVSMILLSPVALSGNNWFSISGLLLFAAVFSIVMFAYLTVSVGFYGKTLGMKIFSLEVVDAEENQYPTLQQAAIHSSIYIGSLACLGAGFATMFFNEEKRAAHDLLSGTIVVRQF